MLGTATTNSAAEPALVVEQATKRFGAVVAVDEVSMTLQRAEILALLGDNGAGKSTLIKCLSGVHRPESGQILIDGKEVTLRSPQEARRHGVETVYQDLALFDNLSVAENFFAGRELTAPKQVRVAGWIRSRHMRSETAETLERLEVHIPNLNAPVGLLSGGQRQAIAVARAVHFASRVVILDEPTAALGMRETKNVQRLIKRLPGEGISVILISHNLEQVMEVADRVMVMRRGRKIGEASPDPSSHDRIVSMIVGAQHMGA